MPLEQQPQGACRRIGFFHPYPHRLGGSQQVALLLARHLSATGYEPVIVCPEDGSFTTAAREAGIEVVICTPDESWRRYGQGSHGIWGWLSLRHARGLVQYWIKLGRTLREQRIALLHCHNVRAAIMAAQAGRLAGIPTLWHVHGAPPEGLAGWVGQWLGLAAQVCVFVSNGMLESWTGRRFLLRAQKVIHNGIDEIAPVTPLERDPARPLIVVVGTLSAVKGQDLLLAALPEILRTLPDLKCWIVGKDWADGRYETELRDIVRQFRLEHCVQFLGERRDATSLLATSDCVVVPSRSEAFGMVAIEAMAQGKPVVAFAVGGLRDIVIHGETGLLTAAANPIALAHDVVRILKDSASAHAMGVEGRTRVRQHFSASRMAQQFASTYDEMFRPRPQGRIRATLARLWYGAFMRKQWTIGVARRLAHLDQRHIERIPLLAPLSDGDFLADPFLVPGTRGRVLLCEQMQASTGRGIVVRVELDEEGNRLALAPLIERKDCHLSYPYTFEHAGRLYCCPEAAESGEIRLYQLSTDARRVIGSTVLLPNFPGKDPSIFRHEGRWWLLCTPAAAEQSQSHLYAFHASELDGAWSAHRRNPIVIDSGRARPAGTVFERDGELFRPGQDCTRTYGAAIRVSRIVRLTPEEYREEAAWDLYPPVASRGGHGIHTLSIDGDAVAIDACEHVYDLLAWARRVVKRVRPQRWTVPKRAALLQRQY